MKSGSLTYMLLAALACLVAASACNNHSTSATRAPTATPATEAAAAKTPSTDLPADDINPPPDDVVEVGSKLEKSDEEWRAQLTAKQFKILRQAGTEFAGTGAYNKFYEDGTYHCSACNAPLFSSDTKFDSKTGWPSFWAPIEEGRVGEHADNSLGITRTEIVCEHCGGHLGHVFTDGPQPTGLRYCVNSISLYFRPSD